MTPAFSVVIPTHNRRETLAEVLGALDRQEGAPPFEVVVVDDGSTDGTAAWLATRTGERPLRLLAQENRGPAAARNRGVAAAAGARIAFLGDDTVPEAGWLARHEERHRLAGARANVAVLGYTAWHPRMRVTPFLSHINEYGLQFGYALIDRPDRVPFNFFYTSNVSLAREWLLAEPFDESFPDPAWEDIEAAYRMFERGLELLYEPRARVLHDHPTDYGRFADRQRRAGRSAVRFARKHPALRGFLGLGPDGPPPLPPLRSRLPREWLVRALQKLPVSLPGTWEEALRIHYLRGLHDAWREEP